MQQKSPTKQKLFFVLTVLSLFFIGNLKSQAQNTTGISLTWNIGVGCQTYTEDRKGDSQVEIYDMTGRMISSFNNKETQGIYELDLAPMATGVYVVILRQGGAVLMQRKLIIK
jgi:hypothetical protein